VVIGIHTPEFDHEREPEAVRRAVERLGLDYPHLLDNDSAYWNALGNQYWPTLHLVDRCGRIRARQIGEVHSGAPSGRTVEAQIQALLEERRPCGPAREEPGKPRTTPPARR
jgi:hypothetical protein